MIRVTLEWTEWDHESRAGAVTREEHERHLAYLERMGFRLVRKDAEDATEEVAEGWSRVGVRHSYHFEQSAGE